MKHQAQAIPDTKSGSLETYIAAREQKKKILDRLETFERDIEINKMMAKDQGEEALPVVEADKDVIEHVGAGRMRNDKNGYLIYKGCIVCEPGKKEDALKAHNEGLALEPHHYLQARKNR